jgi:transcriptional regulator with GAF, ATPase, and Fis domain
MRAGFANLGSSLWRGLRRMPFLSAPLRSGGDPLRSPLAARRRFLIVLASFLVCGYAGGVLGYVLLTPEIGVRCAFTPVVNYFYPEFLYPGQEPLREGDRIVRLAGTPVENWTALLRKLNALRHEGPEHLDGWSLERLRASAKTNVVLDGRHLVRVEYQRPRGPGETPPETVWCLLGRAPLRTLVPSVLWFLLKGGLFLVGALVLWKRPQDRSAAQFFRLCIVSCGAYLGGYHWSRIATQPALLVVFMVCAVLLPPVSLHFYLLFPRPKGALQRRPLSVLAFVYGPPLFFLLLILSGYLRVRWFHDQGTRADVLREMLVEIYCYFAVAALWYLASVACLVHSYCNAANGTERNQVKWILFGGLTALVFIGYSLYLAFLEQGRFGGGAATWPMFAASLCITVAFAVSITRYRLMELDQLVSSGFIYFLISFVAGLVYYGLVFAGMVFVDSQVGTSPMGHVLAVSTTALVLMLALDLVRGRLRRALDRHFRQQKHQLDRIVRRMSQAIEQLVDPPTLGRRLLHTTAELLNVMRGAVYLRQGDPPLYHLVDSLGPAPALTELSSGCPLVEGLGTADCGLLIADPRPANPPAADAARRQLQFVGGAVACGLLHEGQLLGLLCLGPREGAPYSAEDYHLLAAFAQVTVLALVSAEGHRTIDVLNRELQTKVEKIAEQQRRILALQNQLLRKTEDGRRKAEDNPEGAPAPEAAPPPTDFRLPEGMVGSGPRVRQLLHLVRKVAASDSAVLLRGESGTGKEVLARAVHENSPRAARPFVTVHCAALSAGLLESELFGHVKGAFTNAIRDKVGRFEAAHGGTLFLDEIGDISLEVQTKLLRVLQEKTFERVGSSEPTQVDVRVLAATHQDLEGLMRRGRFREDLFYRLNVFPIALPPLRERAEDIPELVLHFLRLYGPRTGKAIAGIDDDALALLKAYSWPGNIRQLENFVQRAVVVADKPVVTADDLPPELLAWPGDPLAADGPEAGSAEADGWPSVLSPSAVLAGEGPPPPVSVLKAARAERERRERELFVRALAAAGGNKSEAARALGMARSTLVSRMKRLGLS